MKKIFITLIASMFILFIIWTFIIAINNNFDIAHIRFNLKATIDQLNAQQEADFEKLVKEIQMTIKTYEIQQQASQNNWFLSMTNSMSWLGTAGMIFLSIMKYIAGLTQLILNIITFIFNPITY